MPITVQELRRRLQNLSREQVPGVLKGMKTAAIRIEGYAKRECPIVTGHLRNDGMWSDAWVEDENTVVGFVGNWVEYAPAVHNGHRVRTSYGAIVAIAKYGGGAAMHEGPGWVAPRPFILNPIIEHREDTLRDLAAALGEVLEKEAKT